MDPQRLEVEIYQIADDAMMKKNRTDGQGWDWCWADWQRDWMNATPHRFAYRCLPLTIINQTGWWIKNPIGFTATWNGSNAPGSIEFRFDTADDVWRGWINSQFGEGIITWNTPFLFRTKPSGSRLLICGPPNYFKPNVQPLTALIESDWISMSFTMNWKVMVPGQPVRFEVDEPLFQAIPLMSNVCADLEGASVSYQKLTDNPTLNKDYNEWDQGRRRFHDQKSTGAVKPSDWQKDYFQGRDANGRPAPSLHMQKIKPPTIHFAVGVNGNSTASGSLVAMVGSDHNRDTQHEVPVSNHQAFCPHNQLVGGPQMAANSYVPNRATATVTSPDRSTLAPDPLVSLSTGRANGSTQTDLHQNISLNTTSTSEQSRVNDEWRRWIAENLMIGQPPESILAAMTSGGFSAEESARELQAAQDSPYLKGSALLLDRLKKRDWLLAVYRKSNRLHPMAGEIERRQRPSRDEFLREYYSTNRPVVITGMMDDWPAMRKWNLDYFARTFGDREVEVQMGRTAGANYEIEREKYMSKIQFGDFVQKVRTAGETNDFYLTANNNSSNRKVLSELWDDIVQVPEYLAADRPGGFFWMGPRGTITPFHHDLTNNFMAQVIGRKRVKIAPSWEMPLMRNNLHCFSQVDGRTQPAEPRPPRDEPQIYEVMLNPGEMLFLPIGCLHYVQGVEISVTVSFTNFVYDNDFSSFYSTYGPV